MNGIDKAVKKAGGSVQLARQVQVDRQLMDYWVKTGRPSPKYCIKISELTGVPLSDLRPDVYPKQESQIA